MKLFRIKNYLSDQKKSRKYGFTIIEVAAMALLLIIVAALGADMGILVFASDTCDKACKDCARAAGTARTPGQAIDAVNTALGLHINQLNPLIMSNLTAQLMVYEDYNVNTPSTSSNTSGSANGPWETTTGSHLPTNSATVTGTGGVPGCNISVPVWLSNSYNRNGWSPGPYVIVRTTLTATVPAPLFFYGSSVTPNQIQVASVCSAPLINTYASVLVAQGNLVGVNQGQANSTTSTANSASSTNTTATGSTQATVTNPTNTSSTTNSTNMNSTNTNSANTANNSSTNSTATNPTNTSTNNSTSTNSASTNSSGTTANSSETASNSTNTASTATNPTNTSTNNSTSTDSESTNSSGTTANSSETASNSTNTNSTATNPTNTLANSTATNSANTVATAANAAATAANSAATAANSTNTAANASGGVPDGVMGQTNDNGGHS